MGGGITSTMIVLMATITTGIIAGNIIRSNSESSHAASSNITVTDNNQIVTVTQGQTLVNKTTTVTVKDSGANYGYALSARISQSTLPAGSSVSVGSHTLSSSLTDIDTTTSNYATRPQGETQTYPVQRGAGRVYTQPPHRQRPARSSPFTVHL